MPLPFVLPLRPLASPDTGQDTGGSAHHLVEDLNPPTTPVGKGRSAARSLDLGGLSLHFAPIWSRFCPSILNVYLSVFVGIYLY